LYPNFKANYWVLLPGSRCGIVSKGEAFWTYSGGLAGVIGASAGNDLYHPFQAFIIACGAVVFAYKMHYWVEKRLSGAVL